MTFVPCLVRSSTPAGERRFALGHPLVDSYLEFVAGRARPNTLRAVAFDLRTFFSILDKEPAEVVAADVFDFLAHQRGDRTVIRMSDRESRLSARTIARRLSSVAGFYSYLIARGDTGVTTNPVKHGFAVGAEAEHWRAELDWLFDLRDSIVHHADDYGPLKVVHETENLLVAIPAEAEALGHEAAARAARLAREIADTCRSRPKPVVMEWIRGNANWEPGPGETVRPGDIERRTFPFVRD